MASSDSQSDKPQRYGRPKRAELPDVNINTGAQSINTERTSLKLPLSLGQDIYQIETSVQLKENIMCYDGLQSIPRESNGKDVAAMLDELTIQANEESFVIILQWRHDVT